MLSWIRPTLLPTYVSMLTVAAAFSTNATLIDTSARCMVRYSALHSVWHSSAACRIVDGLSTAKAHLPDISELFTDLSPATCCDRSVSQHLPLAPDVVACTVYL